MNVSYEWEIFSLQKAPLLNDLSDVITHISFTYTGTDADSGYSAVFHGACPLEAPGEDYEFIELQDLTKENVISWAKAAHPVDHMNNVIETDINAQIQPKNIEVTTEEVSWLGTSISE